MDLTNVKSMIGSFPPWMLLGAGVAFGWVKNFWSFIYGHTIGVVSKKVRVSLLIEEQDHKEAFLWINSWMEEKLRKKKIASLRLEKKYKSGEDTKKEEYELLPGYGFYFTWWNKKLITFESSKKESNGGGGEYSPSGGNNKLIRTVDLHIWGTRNRQILYDILLEAKELFEKAHPKVIRYYVHRADYWDDYPLRNRSLDTVYLPEKLVNDILEDFQTFYQHENKYRSLGIPYRRGYLFEGPPGSGKTTLVQALASKFKVRIYYVNLTSGLNASALGELLNDCVSPCIVLMEDVDCVNAAKDRKTEDKDSKEITTIKTNELLNILDGLVATEDRVIIMTTNHPDKLDPALLRAGRVDRRFHIGWAVDKELQRFHTKASEFYSLPDFSTFRKMLPEHCTIADAQAMMHKISNNTLDKELITC